MEGQAYLKVLKQLNIIHHQSRAGFIPKYQMVVDLSAGDSYTSELNNSIADLPDVPILEAFVKVDPLLH